MFSRLSQCATLTILTVTTSLASAQSTAPDAHATLLEWVRTEKLIAEEAADWRENQAMLESMIEVLSQESSQIEAQMTELEHSIAESTAQIQDIADRQALIQADIEALAAFMPDWETRALAVSKSWPAPLQHELSPLPPLTDQPSAERWLARLSAWVERLSQADDFNRRVTVYYGVDRFPDGKSWEVSEIYYGLGGAYWRTRGGQRAGWLEPADNGWVRHDSAELGPLTEHMIAIAERRRPAAYLATPVSVD